MKLILKLVLAWSYSLFLFGFGVGFLAGAAGQSAAAADYRNAVRCGVTVTGHCYELFPGTIGSVRISQSKAGERDALILLTDAGHLQATVTPSSGEATHVRTGASVLVERYENQVTMVEVDGYQVPSTANPAATKDQLSLYGWLFIALGGLSVAVNFLLRWRRTRRRSKAPAGLAGTPVQPVLLPSGRIGREVRPAASSSTLARHGFGALLLFFLTSPALFDPGRRGWAILLYTTLLSLWAAALVLYLRNARFFTNADEIGRTDLLGRTRTWRLAEISRAERFSVSTRGGNAKHLVFVNVDGHKAFEVAGQFWDFERLDEIVKAARITTSGGYEEQVGALSLNKRVPGLTNWGQQAAILVGILIICIPVLILMAGPTSR